MVAAVSKYFLALGAGFMLAAAILEILPESVALAGNRAYFLVLVGYFIVHFFEHNLAPHFHFGEETLAFAAVIASFPRPPSFLSFLRALPHRWQPPEGPVRVSRAPAGPAPPVRLSGRRLQPAPRRGHRSWSALFSVAGGWISFLSILLRFVLTVSAAIVLVAVTGIHSLCAALEKLGVPRALVTQLLVLYRYLFVLLDEAGRMDRARALRSLRPPRPGDLGRRALPRDAPGPDVGTRRANPPRDALARVRRLVPLRPAGPLRLRLRPLHRRVAGPVRPVPLRRRPARPRCFPRRERAMSHHLVVARDLRYRYPDGTSALDGITFRIVHGESVGIVGANGAGKSTLLLHLNGTLLPASGEVRIGEELLTPDRIPEVRRRVGMIFQDPDDQLFMPTVGATSPSAPATWGSRRATCGNGSRPPSSASASWGWRHALRTGSRAERSGAPLSPRSWR